MKKVYLQTPEEVIKALKEGKTVKSGYDSEFVLKYGFVIMTKSDKPVSVNATLFFDDVLYIEEQEPLKLEVGKFYKTRDGRKAWIIEGSLDWGAFPFRVATPGEPGSYYVAKDGIRFLEDTDGTDLVAPWEEDK